MPKCHAYSTKSPASCLEFKECKILGNYTLEETFDIGFQCTRVESLTSRTLYEHPHVHDNYA